MGGNAKKLARVAGGLAKKRQLAQRAGMLKKLARAAGGNAKKASPRSVREC